MPLKTQTLRYLSDPNFQTAFIDLLVHQGIKEPAAVIKNYLNFSEFIIEEATSTEIISIRKKTTNELFKKDDKVWSTQYNKELGPIWFDNFLTGTQISGGLFYINYVRTTSGIYPLSLICHLDSREDIRLIDRLEKDLTELTAKVKEIGFKPKAGDWIYDSEFKMVNQILNIEETDDDIKYEMRFENRKPGPIYVTNLRYATSQEISEKLLSEIRKIKPDYKPEII